jgi:hypothetical protein
MGIGKLVKEAVREAPGTWRRFLGDDLNPLCRRNRFIPEVGPAGRAEDPIDPADARGLEGEHEREQKIAKARDESVLDTIVREKDRTID